MNHPEPRQSGRGRQPCRGAQETPLDQVHDGGREDDRGQQEPLTQGDHSVDVQVAAEPRRRGVQRRARGAQTGLDELQRPRRQ